MTATRFSDLKTALSWNYLSLFFLGVSGFGVAGCIAYFYGANALGYFNLVNAIYMVLMQISTMGIHHSVLMHLAKQHQEHKSDIILSGLMLSMALNLPLVLLLYFFAGDLAGIFHNIDLTLGLKLIAPPLFLFSINKILLWALNGLRLSRAYSFFQALRYVCVFIFVFIISVYQLNSAWLLLSFLFAEAIVSLFLLLRFKPILAGNYSISITWLKSHLSYGVKGIASGLFLTLNLNIDLIILGLYVSQQQLGVYSFSAVIVIGLYQLLTAVRISMNPILANQLAEKDFAGIMHLIAKSRRYILMAMSALSLVLLGFIPLLISVLLPGKGFADSWYILGILLIGVVVYSAFFPFDQILAMGGYPGQQTFYNFFVLFSNAILNFLLVPSYGIYGAATATTIASAVIAPLVLRALTKYYLKVDLVRLDRLTFNFIPL